MFTLAIVQSALELGFIYALVAMALFLSFRVLNIADMTTDGAFTLGCAVSATAAVAGHPFLGFVLAMLAGACAGFVTAFLQTHLGVPSILAGIITNTGLYTVNLAIMGFSSNVPMLKTETVFTMARALFGEKSPYKLIVAVTVTVVACALLILFLGTRLGLSIRATGDNPDMVRASTHTSPFSRITKADRELFTDRLVQLGLGLENRMKQPVGLLSGGQRQALTLLMATLVTPKLLLLDEHTAALDPATADKVLELTKKIVAENHITCLMITHNMHAALELGNRTLMMDSGHIVLDISGEERANTTVDGLLDQFAKNVGRRLDNDRILLSRQEETAQ